MMPFLISRLLQTFKVEYSTEDELEKAVNLITYNYPKNSISQYEQEKGVTIIQVWKF